MHVEAQRRKNFASLFGAAWLTDCPQKQIEDTAVQCKHTLTFLMRIVLGTCSSQKSSVVTSIPVQVGQIDPHLRQRFKNVTFLHGFYMLQL